jgi:hypothetical protein
VREELCGASSGQVGRIDARGLAALWRRYGVVVAGAWLRVGAWGGLVRGDLAMDDVGKRSCSWAGELEPHA